MSKELIGSNREVVGSPAYFEKLHNAHFSGTLRCSRGDDFADRWNLWRETAIVICSSQIWSESFGSLNGIWSRGFGITITSGMKTQTIFVPR